MVNLYVNLTSCVQRNHIVFNYTFSRHFYDAKILTLCVYWVQQNIAYKRVCAHLTNEQNELRETARKTEQTSLPTIVNMHSRNNFERHKYSSDIDDNNQGHLIECNVSLAVIHFYQTNANHLHVTIPEASNILFSVGNNQMDSVNFQTSWRISGEKPTWPPPNPIRFAWQLVRRLSHDPIATGSVATVQLTSRTVPERDNAVLASDANCKQLLSMSANMLCGKWISWCSGCDRN